jgi:glucose/arabinose dehydrogenase
MNASSHTTRRLATTTGLVAVLATLAIPVSLAVGPSGVTVGAQPSNKLDPAIATAIVAHKSVKPLDTAANSQGLDPAIARAMSSHRNSPTGVDTSSDALDVPVASAIAAH